MIKAVIFDLDGTLADTLTTLAYYGNRTLAHLGLGPIETERFRYLVGRGIVVLMQEMLIACGKEPTEDVVSAMVADFNGMYIKDTMYLTDAYKGIRELIGLLKEKGYKLAVCSNKPDEATQVVVNALFGDIFDLVLGKREEFPRKPAPDSVLYIARALGCAPEQCLYVGDTDTDMQTGNSAKMPTVGVLWGFRDREELERNGATFIAEEPQDILNTACRLNGETEK